MRAHAELDALMPYVHLPVQSGSDRMSGGDEPQAHAPGLSRRHRALARRPRPISPSPRISSSASPARPKQDFRDTLSLVDEVGYRQRLLLHVFAAPGHAGRRHGGPGSAGRKSRAAAAAAGADHPPPARLQCRFRRPRRSTCCWKSPASSLGNWSASSPYLQAVQVMAPRSLIGEVVRVTVTEVGSNSLFGALADEDAPARRNLPQQELKEIPPCAHRIPRSRPPPLRKRRPPRRSCLRSRTTGWPPSCSANTDKTWR